MRARPVVGLDIGTSCVRAAELSAGGRRLSRFGQLALPPGAVHAGEVVDPDAVAAALRQLWSETRFASKRVVVGVANQRVVVRSADLPWLPEAELRGALAYQVQDLIPMPVDEALLDFHPVEEFTDDTGARTLRVLLVAASRDMVRATLAPVTAAGLRPVAVDLTPFALLRSVVPDDPLGLAAPEAEALVEIGAGVSTVVVHLAGVPRFVRILLAGGASLTESVAERLGVPLEEAEAIKQATGLSSSAGPGLDPDPATRVLEISGSRLVEEVRGSLDYYLSKPGSARIARLVLSGGGGQLPGLAERLATGLRLPVVRANPTAGLEIGSTGLTPEQLEYVEPLAAVAVGLALRSAA